MKPLRKFCVAAHSAIALLFGVCALALVGFAAIELWHGVDPFRAATLPQRFNGVLEGIGLLTIAVAALELSQTVLEEEVQREAQMSAPTRVRRFLSRFLIVVVVSLSIELLVAVFELVHTDTSRLPHVAMIGFAAAALLAAWGVFIRMNKSAEQLEPEAMAQAKREDRRVE